MAACRTGDTMSACIPYTGEMNCLVRQQTKLVSVRTAMSSLARLIVRVAGRTGAIVRLCAVVVCTSESTKFIQQQRMVVQNVRCCWVVQVGKL